jgi:hypothetical protein
METTLVPEHYTGKQNDLRYEKKFENISQAAAVFERTCSRLLKPAQWSQLIGSGSPDFQVVDAEGVCVSRIVQEGDFLRIDLPGPGPQSGDGYDWVRIDAIERKGNDTGAQSLFAMRVSACGNPTENSKKGSEDAAHFFKTGASSTFELVRDGGMITMAYHGRNEVPNTATDSILDNVRNAVAGTLAIVGISELQWSALLKSLVED